MANCELLQALLRPTNVSANLHLRYDCVTFQPGRRNARNATMTGLTLTGLEGKVAVVTGAGRMRSIGRPIAVELVRAGCDIVLTGTGRPPERYPEDEKRAGWRDIESVAEEVQALGRRVLPVPSDVSDFEAVQTLADRVMT